MTANTNRGSTSKFKLQTLTLSRVKKMCSLKEFLFVIFNSDMAMVCPHICLWHKRSAYRDHLSSIKVFHLETIKAFPSRLQTQAKIKPSTTLALLAIRNQCFNWISWAQPTREQAAKTLCARLMTQPNTGQIRISRKHNCLLDIWNRQNESL